MNDAQENAGQQADSQHARPVAKFSGSGGLAVAVWKNRTDNGPDHYSIKLERRFKSGEQFESTPYLREGDLLRAQKLLGQADDWIEQDRAAYRAARPQSEQAR